MEPIQVEAKLRDDAGASYSPSTGLLRGKNVLIITSGHEATDSRIYAKEVCSLQRMGAAVTVVGKLEHGTPGEVAVLRVPKPLSRLMRFVWQPWRCLMYRCFRHICRRCLLMAGENFRRKGPYAGNKFCLQARPES